jgi:hypothetical protein
MSMLVWVMMAIAIWHFTVFLPDHFWGGIVGALLAAIAGAVLFGLVIHGFDVPGQDDTDLIAAFEAVVGSCIGLAVAYWYGLRQESSGGRAAAERA